MVRVKWTVYRKYAFFEWREDLMEGLGTFDLLAHAFNFLFQVDDIRSCVPFRMEFGGYHGYELVNQYGHRYAITPKYEPVYDYDESLAYRRFLELQDTPETIDYAFMRAQLRIVGANLINYVPSPDRNNPWYVGAFELTTEESTVELKQSAIDSLECL